MEEPALTTKLQAIGKVFDIPEILKISPDSNYIQKYYKLNRLAYTLFHTSTDLIYMGVSRDGVYKASDLLEAGRTVEKYIANLQATNVLELATGRGANSFYLAQRHPSVSFSGVDISEGQLQYAKKKAKVIDNYSPLSGDYHNLSKFADSTFDIVFVVEALCYSERKDVVLREVFRVLKPKGVFVIFDGYREKSDILLTESERTARTLTEKTMALNQFETYESFIDKVRTQNFSIEKEEDVSEYVVPTMNRFEKMAKTFFRHPHLAKVMNTFLPKEVLYNAIAGYLMPNLMRAKVFSYKITILKKNG